MFTASELFDLAVRVEENGERFYRSAFKRAKSQTIKELLGWLADQEAEHRNTFSQIREAVAGQTRQDPAPGRDILRSAMGRHAFSLEELEVGSEENEEDILRAALGFEEDTLLFFDFISPFVSNRTVCGLLDKIKAEEREHKKILLDKISEIQK